jgi:hypothetical protein
MPGPDINNVLLFMLSEEKLDPIGRIIDTD